MSIRLGRKVRDVAIVALLSWGIASCGSGGGGGGTGTFSSAAAIIALSAVPATDFATSGNVNLVFTATDSNGNPVLAPSSGTGGPGGLNCTVTVPAGISCSINGVSFVPPVVNTGQTLATAIDIDNTGSMGGPPRDTTLCPTGNPPTPGFCSDPDGIRKTAAQNFIQILGQTSASNMISVFDFNADTGSGNSLAVAPFTASKVDFPWATLSSSTIITNAQNSVNAFEGGSTNLFDSVFEICTDMATQNDNANTNSSAINTNIKSMLILTDGDDNASTHTLDQVVTCLRDNHIVAFTVGLGAGISPSGQNALNSMSNANAGGVYATATDASILTPIFQAIAGGTTSGFNSAVMHLNPVPSGTVTGTVSNGTGTANFTFTF